MFPSFPRPGQTLVHRLADGQSVNKTFAADIGLVIDATDLLTCLNAREPSQAQTAQRQPWARKLREIQNNVARWPTAAASDGVYFPLVIRELQRQAPNDLTICLDSGIFAASVYRSFSFSNGQRLVASPSGAMGYGLPAEYVESECEIEEALQRGLAATGPCLIEVRTSLETTRAADQAGADA